MGKITEARITQLPRPMPEGMFDPMPVVMVKVDGGLEQSIFSFYPDELTFEPDEFIGLSIVEAQDLKRKKDLEYLKS